jgi:hypothetical protein
MKFRVNSPEHSEQIQKKLFEMGYRWQGYSAKVQDQSAKLLIAGGFGEKDICITRLMGERGDEQFFNEFKAEEYILSPQNTFVKRSDYYKQPETKSVEKQDVPYVYSYSNETFNVYLDKELLPKEEHQRLRKMDILRAMLKKLEQKEDVPDEWHEELNQLMWERQNSKQFIKEKN